MNGQQLAEHWKAIAKSRDPQKIADALHDDAIFESPAVHTPQRGKPITTAYLASADKVLGSDDFEYVGEWYGEHSCILEFKTAIDGIQINGVDMISCDEDGLITHFKVMIRPLKAINLVHAKMGEMLQKMAG